MGQMNLAEAARDTKGAALDRLAETFSARKDQIFWTTGNYDGARKLYGGDMLEGLDIAKAQDRDCMAVMENVLREMPYLYEATNVVNIGHFDRWAMPLVRSIFPNLILNELVSVQPMEGPTSLIFWIKFLYSKTKGTAVAGQDIIENQSPDYASEDIDAEQIGTGNTGTNYTGTLSWVPVKPGTIIITAGAQTVTDDGNGNLVGDVGAGTNSIDYSTGAFDVDFAAGVANGVAIVAQYQFNMEANVNQPEIEMQLISRPVQADPQTLIINWSEYAQQDLQRLHGESAENNLIMAQGQEIKTLIEQRNIDTIIRRAALTGTPWSSAPGTGVSQKEHYESFVTRLIENSNQIFGATNRVRGNWLLAGLNVCNVVESLASSGRFVPVPDPPAGTAGPHYIGMLDNRWRVFKYPRMSDNNYTMGYKNTDNMFDVGAVYSPYIMLFSSETRKYEYFKNARGLGSRSAFEIVDDQFYLNGSIT